MTRLQRLQLRQSEARSALGDLLDTAEDKRSDSYADDLGTATTEVRALESELQAALIAEPEPVEEVTTADTSEDRELRHLVDASNVGAIFDAALERRSIDGATADLQQHYNLAANQVPLDLLSGPVEVRAVTPAPAAVGATQNPIIPYVFPSSVGAFLGIPQPRVAVGDSVYSVLSSTLVVGSPAAAAAQAETTGSFAAETLKPGRLQAAFTYGRESAARMAGLDSALRENLSMGLADGLDKQIVAGANGLLIGTNLDANDVSALATFPSYVSEHGFARVDGRFADNATALRSVVGAGTYAHMAAVYRAAGTDRTALDRLMEVTGGVRVSAHVPVVANDKQNNVVRLGSRMDAVAPIWEGITIIPDELSGAAKGQIIITAVMLYAFKILRAEGFHKQQSQVA